MSQLAAFPIPFGNFDQNDPQVKFWTFIVYTWVVAIVALFYFFYLNRVVGQLIGRLLCIYTWRKYKAYLELESIHFAPLSGRILFRNFRYYSRNQSVHVLRGYVTFRYWLRHVRQESDNSDITPQDLPSRFMIRVDGLEWFIYNRTPAYEHLQSVLERMANNGGSNPASNARPESVTVDVPDELPCNTEKDVLFRRFLPVEIVSSTGAITIGLPDLPSILIIHYKEASGAYEAVKSRSAHDYYQTDLNLAFKKVKINLGTNVDYREPVLNQAARVRAHNAKHSWYQKLSAYLSGGILWGGTKEEEIPLQHNEAPWVGLSRYKLANVPTIKRRRFEEYAQVASVLECKRLDLRYYADVAGPAPRPNPTSKTDSSAEMLCEDADIGNGDLPPEWGADITISDGAIHYGPWTDRQRGEMQKFFFPTAYRDSAKTEKLAPGAIRHFVALKVLVKFTGQTSFRIPFREQSKDWRYYDDALADEDGNANVNIGSTGRPYAWVDLKMKGTSSIDVTVPFVLSEAGYSTIVHVALEDVSLITSLNYAPLLTAHSFKMECTLDAPLKWNAARTWTFNLALASIKLFLLRDHVALLTDLVKDWTAGPPTPQDYFTPMTYKLKFTLTDFDLYFCVNQNNVINQPNALSDNTYFVLSGPRLKLDVDLPFTRFDAESTTVGIQIESRKARLNMSFPSSHTIGAFVTEKAKEVGTIGQLTVSVAYRYHKTAAPGAIDSLTLNVDASAVNFALYGYLISHLIFFKENYMGEHNSFMTSDEYRARLDDPEKAETAFRKQEATKEKGNVFEVYIIVAIQNVVAALPESLYDKQECSLLTIGEVQLESRSNDYFLDLQVILQPITWSRGVLEGAATHPGSETRKNLICIQDFSIRSHRLFGLPPKGAVYVADWRMMAGPIVGELQPSSLPAIRRSLRCLTFHFANVDNMISATTILPDLTTLLAVFKSINVSVWGLGSVTTFRLAQGLRLQMDNLIGPNWSERVFVEVPEMLLHCLAVTTEKSGTESSANADDSIWVEVFRATTALSICLFEQTPQWRVAQKLQLDFIKTQDELTKRCTFLYEDENGGHTPRQAERKRSYASRPAPAAGWLPYCPMYIPPFQLSRHHRDATRPDNLAPETDVDVTEPSPEYMSESDSGSSASEDGSESELDAEQWSDGGASKEPPPPPRSIPYRSYLKRFVINRASRDLLYQHVAGRGPGLTSFTEVGVSSNKANEPKFPESLFNKSSKPPRSPEVSPSAHATEQATIVSLDFSQPLKLIVTPITLRILQEGLENLRGQTQNPESIFDTLEMRHTNRLIRSFMHEYMSLSFSVSAPVLQVHCIQDMLLPDVTSFLHQEESTRYELSDKLLCSFDIAVTGVTAKGKTIKRRAADSLQDPRFFESHFVVDVDRVTTKLRFVGNLNASGVVGIPLAKQSHRTHAEGMLEGVPVVLDLLADKIQWKGHIFRRAPESLGEETNGCSLELTTKELSVVSINETIEIMFGAIFKWVTFAVDVARLYKLFALRERKGLQSLIAMVAEKAHATSADGDPAFLTEPSTLWMLGNRKHQEDSGWKLIAHLRYCWRQLSDQVKRDIQKMLENDVQPVTDSKLLFVVVLKALSSWRRWEVTDLSSAPVLRELYNIKPVPTAASHLQAQLDMISYLWNAKFNMDINKLSVTVLEFQNEESSVVIGPIAISAISALSDRESLNQNDLMTEDHHHQKGPSLAMNTSHAAVTANSVLDVRYRVKLDRFDVAMNPNLFGFVRHFVRVHRWFQLRLESANRAKPTRETDESNSSIQAKENPGTFLPVAVFGSVAVVTMSVTATAHNLMAKATLRSLQISTVHMTRPNLLSQKSAQSVLSPLLTIVGETLCHNTMGTILGVHIVMFERVSRNTQPTDSNTLISLAVDDINGSASLSELLRTVAGPPGLTPPQKLAIVTGIRRLELRLPRSLLKLHAFLEKWGDEDLPRYDFLFNKLVKEWDQPRPGALAPPTLHRMSSSRTSVGSGKPKFGNLSFEFLLGHFSVQSDLLTSLNVFYDARDLLVAVTQEDTGGLDRVVGSSAKVGWEARLREHMIKFLSKSSAPGDGSAPDQKITSFVMPSVSSRGSMSQPSAESGRNTPAESRVGFDHTENGGAPTRVEATIEIDRIDASVDVSIIDQLITTQSIFGAELNDVLDIFAFYGRQKAQKTRAAGQKQALLARGGTIFYAFKITVQGLRIAADSPGNIIIFESEPLNGFIMNYPQKELSRDTGGLPGHLHPEKVLWRIAARRFSFSLINNVGNIQTWMIGPRVKVLPLANVVMGVTAQNYGPTEAAPMMRGKSGKDMKMLAITFHQLHAVLQPTAVTGLTDAAMYYQRELERRSTLKAQELSKAKENTERLIKGIRLPAADKQKKQAFFEERIVQIELMQICAAFPLRQGDRPSSGPSAPRVSGTRRSTISSASVDHIPAFLISAKSVDLNSRKLRWASGKVIDLCFQFVPNFDSSNERHFSPLLHPTSNRILLQLTTAEVNRRHVETKQVLRVESGIKGFELEIDASITEFANQLNAIYMTEKDYVVSAVPNESRGSNASVNQSGLSSKSVPEQIANKTNPTPPVGPDSVTSESSWLDFDARFDFEAGTCKVWSSKHRTKMPTEHSSMMSSGQLSTGGASQKTGDTGANAHEDPCLHLLTLPGITLSTVGKAVIGQLSQCPDLEESARGVHIELIIHSSNNVLHPDILHFANEVMANLKVGRMLKHQEQMENGANGSSTSMMEKRPSTVAATGAPGGSAPDATTSAYQKLPITFNLRLSYTKISLSCQPASKVSCNLNLEEADFMFSFIPKAMRKDKTQYLSCTANILGTSGALRHAFSPEDCVNAEIARITFNITTMERKLNRTYAVEIGVPSLVGSLNARHLQDFFLFKRMWFEYSGPLPRANSAPVRNSMGGIQSGRRTYGSSILSFVGDDGRSLKDALYLAARINHIEFAMDLGQAIGKATLGLENLVLSGSGTRSMLGFQDKEVSLKFESLSLKSEGKFSGNTTISGAQTYFTAREPPAPKRGQHESTVGTELVIRIDYLASHLHFQYERILILHVAPIIGGFTDKWVTLGDDLELHINADLTIDTFKGIMSRRTIPTMMHLKSRITQLIEEKRGADPARKGTSNARDTSFAVLSGANSGAVLSTRGKQSIGSLHIELPNPSSQESGAPQSREFLNHFWMGASTVGQINVVLGEAFIVLARYNFRDPDFAQVTSKRIAANYTARRGALWQALEKTDIQLGGLNVKKGTAKPISQVEESMWTTAQWFTFMTSAATKNVFGVRETTVKLLTETYFKQRQVEYSFRTDFSGPIDVALNFGLYKYLQELAQLYEKALARGESAGEENGPRSSGTSPSSGLPLRPTSPAHPQSATSTNSMTPTSESPTHGGKRVSRDSASPTPGGASTAAAAAAKDAAQPSMEFVRKGEMVFEPQLKVTGDATPWEWVQWLGVHKDKVPRLVYEQVTCNLAHMVDALSGIHRKVAIPVQDVSEAVNIDTDPADVP
ncbi:hypothetical protein HDU86_000784 [Geranomyces michiganensis]|nr:hypothetical protein HDU86_000784 [Geranomyces michiganensis]